MITSDGWHKSNIWAHSRTVQDLYLRRARGTEQEMTCAAQAAEIIASLVTPGDTLLDAGCGSGYFYHSLTSRNIPAEYFGIDATDLFIQMGKRELPTFGLRPQQLKTLRIEDLAGSVDHVLCMNVLSNVDNYHRPLERLLCSAKQSVLIRESIKNGAECRYVKDHYLDDNIDLKVYVNTYDRTELMEFIKSYQYDVEEITDRRSGGKPEVVIGYPHYWTFILAKRTSTNR